MLDVSSFESLEAITEKGSSPMREELERRKRKRMEAVEWVG